MLGLSLVLVTALGMASNQLKAFLGGINEKYVQYADQLHHASFSDVQELAAASPELLRSEANVPIGPAGAIVKAAGNTSAGEASTIPVHVVTTASTAAGRACDQELVDYMEMLLDLNDKDGFLRLPMDRYPRLPILLRKPVFIRPSYKVLWNKYVKEQVGKPTCRAIMLLGNPGTGKSAAAVLLLKRLAELRQNIYYSYEAPMPGGVMVRIYRWDCQDPTNIYAEELTPDQFASDKSSRGHKAWLVHDGPPASTKAQYQGEQNTIVLTSPNRDNHHNYSKNRSIVTLLHLPVWTLAELEECRSKLYPHIPAESVAQRFKWLGGIIRFLLDDDRKPEEIIADAATADNIQELVSAVVYSSGGANFSHVLGHFAVTEELIAVRVNFASLKVADFVLSRIRREHLLKVREMLVSTAGDAGVAGVRGRLFESIGHRRMLQGGVECQIRLLQNPNISEAKSGSSSSAGTQRTRPGLHSAEEAALSIGSQQPEPLQHGPQLAGLQQPALEQAVVLGFGRLGIAGVEPARAASTLMHQLPAGLQHRWENACTQLNDLRNVYLQPSSAANAAWDAAILYANDNVDILQFTVSRTHGIKKDGILKLLDRLGSTRPARIVFVVPPDVFHDFPWQHWQGLRGCHLSWDQLPNRIKQLHQHVLQLEFAVTPDGSTNPSPRTSGDDAEEVQAVENGVAAANGADRMDA